MIDEEMVQERLEEQGMITAGVWRWGFGVSRSKTQPIGNMS